MPQTSGPPPISSLVAGMTATELLIYSELLGLQNLLADMLGAHLATVPEATSEAFKASRRTARLRLSPSFGPLNVEVLEALNDCVQAAIGRTLDLASAQEAANRAMRAARAVQGTPEGSRTALANDPVHMGRQVAWLHSNGVASTGLISFVDGQAVCARRAHIGRGGSAASWNLAA